MNTQEKKGLIPLCYRAGLTIEATSRLLVDKQLVQAHWNEPELKRRLGSLEKQRAMPRLVQALHAAGKKDTEISRCGLSQRTVLMMLVREL
ncbi:hypothetical protein H5A40_17170 [Pectobacterium brasiliense]|uniref:hypothetical protein n=1 Tax=Pectobacterium brasiliense TaxID=180957 RepID=UPI00196978EB|nr:hypothetical protein [Pectobacterium brasiliense]QSD34783.1 hypothetical protein H5A40_17170 [Pectobacterium brasiliense]